MSIICKICTHVIENTDYFYLSGSSFISNNLRIKDLLHSCISDLNVDVLDDSLICRNCTSALHITYSFHNLVLKNKDIFNEQSNQVNLCNIETEPCQTNDFNFQLEYIYEDDAVQPINQFVEDFNEQNGASNEKIHPCDKCDFTTDCIASLLTHQRIHTNEVSKSLLEGHQCDECNFTTYSKISLISHRRIHKGEKSSKVLICPHICAVCNKGFITKHVLMKHQLLHTRLRQEKQVQSLGVKTRICHICGKCLSGSSALSTHMKIHLDSKSHLCELCGKYFLLKSKLTDHQRIHLTEKPFKCAVCDYSASRKSHVRSHMNTHTDSNLLECVECGKRYSSKILFYRHRKMHKTEKLLSE